jgi:single-stranded-DNA-specific exonuclease
MAEDGTRVPAVYFGDVEAFAADMREKYGERELEAAFRGSPNAIRISVVYYPEINEYQGMESIQIIIRNYR